MACCTEMGRSFFFQNKATDEFEHVYVGAEAEAEAEVEAEAEAEGAGGLVLAAASWAATSRADAVIAEP
jgi:hypothetical protein